MAGYVKLFDSVLDSTVWESSPPTKVVWITLLCMADRDGIVGASVPGLAKRAGVERSECERALALFMAPDPDSRTKLYDGRRLEEVDGGWRVLNYEAYRDRASSEEKRLKDAERQRRKYERDKAKQTKESSHTSRVSLTPLTVPHQTSPLISSAEAPESAEAGGERAAPKTLLSELLNAWDGSGGAGVSPIIRTRLAASGPLLVRLATERGTTPLAVFLEALGRFASDANVRAKRLGRSVMLNDLEMWCSDTVPAKGAAKVVPSAGHVEEPFPWEAKANV